jgi:CBS domain-containing protein
MITDPIPMGPDKTVSDALDLMAEYRIWYPDHYHYGDFSRHSGKSRSASRPIVVARFAS